MFGSTLWLMILAGIARDWAALAVVLGGVAVLLPVTVRVADRWRCYWTAAYLALIIWSLYQPTGFSSYFYLGFLIGDIATWLIFSAWGWQKSMVEFSFKDLAIHAGGLLFFILLNTREGSFVVARDLRNEAIAILIMVAVVSGAAKWVARFFGLIRRVTEGF